MDRLQPDHLDFEPNPDAEDEVYDRRRQKKLDDEIDSDLLRQQAEDQAVASAMKILGLGEAADSALRTLYRFGVMDGAMRAAREVMA